MLFKHKRVLYTFLIIGGEPTVHGNIVELIRSARVLKECTDAGLEKVNFSIFRTTPEELVEVQNAKYGNVRLVGIKLVAFYNAQLIPLLETILKLMQTSACQIAVMPTAYNISSMITTIVYRSVLSITLIPETTTSRCGTLDDAVKREIFEEVGYVLSQKKGDLKFVGDPSLEDDRTVATFA